MTSSPLARTLQAGAAGLLVVTLAACAPTVTPEAAPADQPSDGATTSTPTQSPATTSATAGGSVSGAKVAPQPSPSVLDARWYDLMHVQQTAAPCSTVWTVGNVLPEDYQWCADEENNPVAGVRVGPCEVVSYGRTMYAIPGRPITSVAGSIDRDQAYLDLLTACKRRPFPPSAARKDAP